VRIFVGTCMTADRSRAYARVLRLLDGLGPSALRPDEQAIVRDAADALVLTLDLGADDEAKAALDRLDDTVERLVETERLAPETAEGLLGAVEACGPARVRLTV
jgi:hypothetical protein